MHIVYFKSDIVVKDAPTEFAQLNSRCEEGMFNIERVPVRFYCANAMSKRDLEQYTGALFNCLEVTRSRPLEGGYRAWRGTMHYQLSPELDRLMTNEKQTSYDFGWRQGYFQRQTECDAQLAEAQEKIQKLKVDLELAKRPCYIKFWESIKGMF